MMKIGTDIAHASTRLNSGHLVAMPTETVYGLAANALDDEAVGRIYKAKGRPSHNPLIIHVLNTAQAQQWVEWNDDAQLLSDAFWPGPLTMVLTRRADCPISPLASAGRNTLAVRVPAHHIARKLLSICKLPLAAPSANISGSVTATNAQHVVSDFTNQDVYILEAGQAEIGLESTVVQLSGQDARLLRPGSITQAEIEQVLGRPVMRAGDENHQPASPGMITSHYAPKAHLRLNATYVENDEALLAFGAALAGAMTVFNLSERSDLEEASSRLFAALRQLDASGAKKIAVMPIPNIGIGVAINDRLRRAAIRK